MRPWHSSSPVSNWAPVARRNHHPIERPAPANPNRGPKFRCRRVALGVCGSELEIPADVVSRLPWIEDGTEDPICGWHLLDVALRVHLIRIVGDHMWGGGEWSSLWFAGWNPLEIREASEAVIAAAQES